jgi:hypothetical protein
MGYPDPTAPTAEATLRRNGPKRNESSYRMARATEHDLLTRLDACEEDRKSVV